MNYDLTTPEGVKSYMMQATSEDDWSDRIDAAITAAKWGGSAEIKISKLDL